jgi:HPt (histidine-containing phosphotransfer) domain-containing protein
MPDDPPEFDWSQAESLLGEDPGDVPPDMVEIIVELVQNARAQFQELKQLKPETERAAISAQAHQLRGSLLNFGFVGVGTLLYDVEKKEYAPADYPAMIDQAEKAFHASLKVLTERYTTLRFS